MTSDGKTIVRDQVRLEFIVILALTMSLVALAIDSMLPALSDIAADLNVSNPNDRQMVVTVLFAGFGIAQIFYGPISDSIGRKPAIYAGFVIFIAGTILSILSQDFSTMLVGRFLQGLGAAGPRTVVVAMVRDRYEGRAMARIMSLVTSVFILVPVLAPSIGQAILFFAHWRAIFWMLLLLGIVTAVWFAVRLEETLLPERRCELSIRHILRAVKETCYTRVALGYTVATGLVFGAFIGYLTSAQQIFQEMFGMGKLFPFCFGMLAITFGAASLVNAKLVVRVGMRKLSHYSLLTHTILSLIFVVISFYLDGNPGFIGFMAYMMAAFFLIGLLFSNFNAMAMAPLGHIAGVASSVIGMMTTFISVGCGAVIGHAYQGTILPLAVGFSVLGILSLFVTQWADNKKAETASRV